MGVGDSGVVLLLCGFSSNGLTPGRETGSGKLGFRRKFCECESSERARVTQVLAFGSICQGAMLGSMCLSHCHFNLFEATTNSGDGNPTLEDHAQA